MFKKTHTAQVLNGGSQSRVEDGWSPVNILPQAAFLRMLHLEKKRTERSKRRFVLMLLEAEKLLTSRDRKDVLGHILSGLSRSTRETDIIGWSKEGSVLGFIFTEIGPIEGKVVTNALLTKVTTALSSVLSIEQINQINLSFHVYPEDSSDSANGDKTPLLLYPEQGAPGGSNGSLFLKRLIDITGSIAGLILFSPVFILVSLLVKITSKGPILFRQERVGRCGKRFTFLKFRSMQVNNDPTIHKEFVSRFIAGQQALKSEAGPQPVYKLTDDPRLTSIGAFLRKTSLDELPQFFNVLAGDMSLVGPRPPLPYEVDRYDTWHRRRLRAVKPGITGLWQVTARSSVTFDEMVRLDLRYANDWSLWLDLKILFQTPRAVLNGVGAF